MSIPYFPGCTLSTKGAGFDHSGRAVAEALGMPLEELSEWQCCGATFPLATENSMSFIAPTRLLTEAQEAGGHVTTLCAVCFHVLRRTQHFLGNNPEMLERINWFTEETYEGTTRVSHFLELLRDDLGWEKLTGMVSNPLKGLKVAPYYGCLLLRPYAEINLDNPDEPRILHDLLAALGCDVVDFPYQDECCGSYLMISKPEVPKAMAGDIIQSARKHGAQAIVTACPLCQFNLDYPQRSETIGATGKEIPVVYFTQLMAAALGLPEEDWGMGKHYVDPAPLLQSLRGNTIMNRRVLVLGAGIAGIQASLDIANSGFEVVLVEKEPSVGGHMAQLSETFPTLDCSQCILTPRTVEVGHHENIRLYTYSELESIERSEAGDEFTARIRRKAAYVNWDLCTGCGVCQEKCPFKVESDFERGIGPRKVVYTLSPQAVPNKPVIDAANCRYLQSKWDMEAGRIPSVDKNGNPARPKCGACAKFCPTGAITWDQEDAIFEEKVDAVILATGFDLFPMARLPEYGGGRIPDVIDALAFERMLAASGPTAGKIRRPSDGKEPKEVVFVQCSGSRDPERGMPYCSKICCMYTAKQAILYRHRVHDGQAYVFYIDVRAGGKGYEEFLNRAQEQDNVAYLRGKVSKIYQEGGRVRVKGVDTLTSRTVEIDADLVVLATAVTARMDNRLTAGLLEVDADEHGFFTADNEEFNPMGSSQARVFFAGAALGPKDIPETVSQASGAAAKVLALFQAEKNKTKVMETL